MTVGLADYVAGLNTYSNHFNEHVQVASSIRMFWEERQVVGWLLSRLEKDITSIYISQFAPGHFVSFTRGKTL